MGIAGLFLFAVAFAGQVSLATYYCAERRSGWAAFWAFMPAFTIITDILRLRGLI